MGVAVDRIAHGVQNFLDGLMFQSKSLKNTTPKSRQDGKVLLNRGIRRVKWKE